MTEALASLLDVADEPLAVLDPEGRVRDCNGALLELLHSPREGVQVRSYADLVDPDDRPVVTTALRRLRAGDGVDGVRVAFRAGEDERRLVSLSARPLYDPEGRPAGALAAHREAPVAAVRERSGGYRSDLERELAQRTRELETVRQELQTFVHSVSHDLRRPLRVVNGFVQALEEDYGADLPGEAHDFLQRIHQGTECMSELLNALLDLSRVSGRSLHREPVDLAEMANAVATEVAQADPEAVVAWQAAGPLPDEGDPGLLRILLHNLLENAWKYAGHRPGARVEMGCKRLNGWTVYYVHDNGPGFEPGEAEQLFAPFQRFQCGESEGSGIGLAVVQRIVHRHGGEVWAEAAPGQGATFYFTLGAESEDRPTQLSLLEEPGAAEH